MKSSTKRTPEARVVLQLSRRKTRFARWRICGVMNGPFLIIRFRRVNPITVAPRNEGVEYHEVRGDLTLMREGAFLK